MARYRTNVGTKTGALIVGEAAELSDEEVEAIDATLKDVLQANNGYVALVEEGSGTKYWVPLHSVDVVFLEKL